MPAPLTGWPTRRPAVLATLTVIVLLVVPLIVRVPPRVMVALFCIERMNPLFTRSTLLTKVAPRPAEVAPVVSKKRFPPFSLMAAEPMGLNEPAAEPPVSTSEGEEVKLYVALLLTAVTRVDRATVAVGPGLVICVMKVPGRMFGPVTIIPGNRLAEFTPVSEVALIVALPVVLGLAPNISIVVPLPKVLCCVVPLK